MLTSFVQLGHLTLIVVIFTGLEFGHFQNFEAASLTLTSVALILPFGTVAARRMVRSNNLAYDSNTVDGHGRYGSSTAGGTGGSRSRHGITSSARPHHQSRADTVTSTTPLKSASSFTSSRGTNSAAAAPLTSIMSRCEGGGGARRERPDHFDLELGEIDGEPVDSKKAHVHVESAFEQREERV